MGLIISSLLLLVWWGFFGGRCGRLARAHLKPHRLLSHSWCWGDAKSWECQKTRNARKPFAMPTPATRLHFTGPGWLSSLQLQTGNVDTDRVYITVVLSPAFLSPLTWHRCSALIPCSNTRLKSSHALASSSLVSSTSGEQLQPLGEFPCRGWNHSLCVFSLFSPCSPEESSALEKSVSLCLQIVLRWHLQPDINHWALTFNPESLGQ